MFTHFPSFLFRMDVCRLLKLTEDPAGQCSTKVDRSRLWSVFIKQKTYVDTGDTASDNSVVIFRKRAFVGHQRSFKLLWSSADADKPARHVRLEVSQGHQTWYSSIPISVQYSNCVPEIFDFKKCRDLETRVRGHCRSSEPTRIDPPSMTFY